MLYAKEAPKNSRRLLGIHIRLWKLVYDHREDGNRGRHGALYGSIGLTSSVDCLGPRAAASA